MAGNRCSNNNNVPRVSEPSETQSLIRDTSKDENATLRHRGNIPSQESPVFFSPPVAPDPDSTQLESACVIDGSKLIIRIAVSGKQFQVDHGLKIIFASSPLKRLERTLSHSNYQNEHADCTVVIDAGGVGNRFVPLLPSMLGGVIYTRDGTSHVVVGGTTVMSRSRVGANNLPTKTVNKFVCSQYFDSQNKIHIQQALSDSLRHDVFFPWSTLGNEAGEGGVIFVKSDESIYSHHLPINNKETADVNEGRVVAWTPGITFQPNNGWCCFKKLTHIVGHGALWIDNGKSATNPNVVIAQ